ncbi:MAG: SMC-Scp complex subunit ScpB [Candidatus Tectomicrobia bacterium RIFCSPLOWO2_12_FULL_69_37]|nr:MAG: SMC-Scp complex subunit ScpB [Candidatus Tectomicrobia bacterium RIFCSPLOWO2_12_FULL_69_37]OGL63191.1 MAG: SMC-Scp complex subunit ScpB [Candidatus Tectomicrobia bacterium RIFCSPLOWO2_02_FULL_70_19]
MNERDDAEEGAAFELTGGGPASPEAARKALVEHQMEAIEEPQAESAFDLAEEGAAAPEAEAPGEGAEPAEGTPLIIEEAEAKRIILTLLFVAHEPLRPRDISMIFRGVENINAKVVRKLVAELMEEHIGHPLQIAEVAEGYRMCTRPEFGPWVRRLLKAERKARLSQAGLETLAIVAYKQPITKPEVEEIRRVDCTGVMNTLLERNLVRILGRKDVIGRPIVYGTTPQFLEYFGFKNLADMPKPEEFEALAGIGPQEEAEILPVGGEAPAAAAEAAPETPGSEAAPGGLTIAEADGHPNGHTNGHANGHTNGHAHSGAEEEGAAPSEETERRA